VNIPEQGEFFDNISDYNLFQVSKSGLLANDELEGYDVVNALFTDYAEKDRFVFLPEGQKAIMKEDGYFDFPTGSMLVKNFYYTEDQIEDGRLMETRILLKDENEWRAISYVWDENEKDAKISKVGDLSPLLINHKGSKIAFDYIVPNKNQCKSCHNYNEMIDPLGFKYANLNKEITIENQSVNQLILLGQKGIIDLNNYGNDIQIMKSYLDAELSIRERALAYLDVNCGHCHRPEGPGNTSGLFLQYNETRTNHLGYCKAPVAAGKGSGGRQFDIHPGSADSSILYFRMASLDPGIMMPEIGRSLAHNEGLSIIEEWINSIDYDCYASE
jgi:uncharacterized repeat protein (TIGR03806 family)